MIRSGHKILITGILAGFVAGCGSSGDDQGPGAREFAFAGEGPLTLTVHRVEVMDRYFPPMKAPNVDHEFQVPPIKALHRWARQRFIPGGNDGTLRIILTDAAVTEEELKVTGGVINWFIDNQDTAFNGRVAVRLEYLPDSLRVASHIDASAAQRRTILESSSVNDRMYAWREMTWFLVEALDMAVRDKVADHMIQLVAEEDRPRLRPDGYQAPDTMSGSAAFSAARPASPPADQGTIPMPGAGRR